MLAEADLRAIVRELPLISLSGPWTRAVLTRLLLAPPAGAPRALLVGDASAQRPYRFNPAGRFPVIYLAAEFETALAEVSLTLGQSDPYTIVSINGVLVGVLDLTDADVMQRLGTNAQELSGAWRMFTLENREAPTQTLGRILFEETAAIGVRYASARRTGGTCLAVFTDRLVESGRSVLEVRDSTGQLWQRLPPR